MNKKATDIIAYLSIIGWAVAYYCGTREESKFHLNQGLMFAIANVAFPLLIRLIGGFIGVALGFLEFALFICWVVAFIGACSGEEKKVPFFGDIQLI